MNFDPQAVRAHLGQDTCTPAELSEAMGFKRNYGHQLAKDGRLVWADESAKLVDIVASVERFNRSADPSRQSTVERHAAARAEKADTAEPVVQVTSQPAPPLEDAVGYSYQDAKAKREHWAAEREHAAWRKEAGELMERAEVVAAFADVGATLRSKLEALTSTLPPQLSGRDEAVIRAIVAEQVQQLLSDLSGKFASQAAAET